MLDHFQDFCGPVDRMPGGASFSLQPSALASAFYVIFFRIKKTTSRKASLKASPAS